MPPDPNPDARLLLALQLFLACAVVLSLVSCSDVEGETEPAQPATQSQAQTCALLAPALENSRHEGPRSAAALAEQAEALLAHHYRLEEHIARRQRVLFGKHQAMNDEWNFVYDNHRDTLQMARNVVESRLRALRRSGPSGVQRSQALSSLDGAVGDYQEVLASFAQALCSVFPRPAVRGVAA